MCPRCISVCCLLHLWETSRILFDCAQVASTFALTTPVRIPTCIRVKCLPSMRRYAGAPSVSVDVLLPSPPSPLLVATSAFSPDLPHILSLWTHTNTLVFLPPHHVRVHVSACAVCAVCCCVRCLCCISVCARLIYFACLSPVQLSPANTPLLPSLSKFTCAFQPLHVNYNMPFQQVVSTNS